MAVLWDTVETLVSFEVRYGNVNNEKRKVVAELDDEKWI
jgi:hypothetical protein